VGAATGANVVWLTAVCAASPCEHAATSESKTVPMAEANLSELFTFT